MRISFEYMNTQEACDFMGVSSRTLQRLRDNGKIRFYQDGRIIRYKKADLIDYIERHAIESFDSGIVEPRVISSPRIVSNAEPEVSLTASVAYAPYRVGDVKTVADVKERFRTAEYCDFRNLSYEVMAALGLHPKKDFDTVGGYAETSAEKELSRFTLLEGDQNEIELFCVLMGVLAPDIQSSVLVAKRVEGGGSYEFHIAFSSEEKAYSCVNSLMSNGIEYFTYVPETATLIIVAMDNGGVLDALSEVAKVNNLVESLGEAVGSCTYHQVNAEFISESKFYDVLESAINSVGSRSLRKSEVIGLIKRAIAKLNNAEPGGSRMEAFA